METKTRRQNPHAIQNPQKQNHNQNPEIGTFATCTSGRHSPLFRPWATRFYVGVRNSPPPYTLVSDFELGVFPLRHGVVHEVRLAVLP